MAYELSETSITTVNIGYVIKKIFDDFESRTCDNCKWCKLGGEYDNDTCENTSISAHLDTGTMVASDFGCNRFERKG